MSDILSKNFARALKTLRQKEGWSLQKAADETGISKSMLGQIERCESSPTIVTLWKIATGFHLSFSQVVRLMDDEGAQPTMRVVEDPGFVAKNLMPYDPMTRSEIFEVSMAPEVTHLSPSHNPGIVEHIIPIQGTLQILDRSIWTSVSKGTCYVLDGQQAHGYANPGKENAVFHLIMHYM